MSSPISFTSLKLMAFVELALWLQLISIAVTVNTLTYITVCKRRWKKKCWSATVYKGCRSLEQLAVRCGSHSKPQSDEYFSGRSSRGMTVYSLTSPFSLGWSLCRKVSISTAFCWLMDFILLLFESGLGALLGELHLCSRIWWEFLFIYSPLPEALLPYISDLVWNSLVSGNDGNADHD